MTRLTVVTDARGEIVVVGHGHLSEASARKFASAGPHGGVRAGPGQRLHEIELPEEVAPAAGWAELCRKIEQHLKPGA